MRVKAQVSCAQMNHFPLDMQVVRNQCLLKRNRLLGTEVGAFLHCLIDVSSYAAR